MNYIKIINRFWQMRRACRLTSSEADLLYFLIHESNLRQWENPFRCSNKLICATTGINEKTLFVARKNLQEKGFISFEAGLRNLYSPCYTLILGRTIGDAKPEIGAATLTDAALIAKTNKSTRRFVKPTVRQIEAYCTERKNKVDAQRFFDFYQSKDWMVGRNPMKDWRAAVRNWEREGTASAYNKANVRHNFATTGNKQKYEQF